LDSPHNKPAEFSENCPKQLEEGEMEGQKRKRKAWEWSSVQGGLYKFRKPFFEYGKWRCRRIEVHTGKIERITLEANSLTNAKEEIIKLAEKSKLLSEIQNDIKPIEFKEAADRWIESLDVKEVTIFWTKHALDLFSRLLGKGKILHTITYADLEKLFHVTWKSRTGKTKISYRGILCRFYKWAIKHNYCKENVAENIEVQKKWMRESAEGKLKGQALSLEEARDLLKACKKNNRMRIPPSKKDRAEILKDHRDYLWWFVFISLRTGLRMSNVVGSKFKKGLLWRDVDLEKGILSIDKSRIKNGIDFTVPLHQELWDALKLRLKELGRVPHPEEEIVKVERIVKSFKTRLKAIGIEERKFRVHDLRHSFASWLGKFCTHSIMQILLGHRPQSMTDRYSMHQDIEDLREGLNKLPWLQEVKTPQSSSIVATH
jgi:integrase